MIKMTLLLPTDVDKQGMQLYRLLFVFLLVCLFVRLRIFLPRMKLAASHFARRFIGVQGRESHIFL